MEITNLELVLIPILTGISELAKRVGLPTKWTPLFSVLLGIFFGVFYVSPQDIMNGIIYGLVIGLSSIGLYSGPKNIAEQIRGDDIK